MRPVPFLAARDTATAALSVLRTTPHPINETALCRLIIDHDQDISRPAVRRRILSGGPVSRGVRLLPATRALLLDAGVAITRRKGKRFYYL
jgi:hypothetical protein